MAVNLSKEHSLISNWVSELRDVNVQQDRMRFRKNLRNIAEVAAYEISKELPWKEKKSQLRLALLPVGCCVNNLCSLLFKSRTGDA